MKKSHSRAGKNPGGVGGLKKLVAVFTASNKKTTARIFGEIGNY
jgi:hypothetical protein